MLFVMNKAVKRRPCNFTIFSLITLLCTAGFAPHATAAANIPGNTTINSDGFGIYAPWDNPVSKDTIVGSGVKVYVVSSDASDGRSGAGMYASGNGASITAAGNLIVNADGKWVYGVAADDRGIVKIANSATITTSGDNAYGVYADSFSNIDIGGFARITTTGNDAFGAYALDNSRVNIGVPVRITTSGNGAHGAYTHDSSRMEIGDLATITTSSNDAYGVYANLNSGMRIDGSAIITTSGSGSYGVYASDFSSMDIDAMLAVTTSGNSAYGIYASGNSSMDIGDSAEITTSGSGSYGVYADLNSVIKLNGATRIFTRENDAYGVYASGNSSMDIGDSTEITTSGNLAHGAYTEGNSSVKIDGSSTIATSGAFSRGVSASGNSVLEFGGSSVITTLGNEAYGAYAEHDSRVDIGRATSIATSGRGSYGVYAIDNSRINVGSLATITTTSADAHAVFADSSSSVWLDGARISATGAGSSAIRSGFDSRVAGGGVFNITGSMYAEGYSSIDMTLEDGSRFTGATAYSSSDPETELNLTLNGARTSWNVNNDSWLTNLYMDGATVDMTYAALGAEMFVVNLGQSSADTGVFKMATNIAGGGADHLIVQGAALGAYVIDVLNSGSDATTGEELIDLVFVKPWQTAIFTLDHAVELGGFQYELHQPDQDTGITFPTSTANHESNAWYLGGPSRASTPGTGAINSFAGSYLMAYADTQTLIQRMGDLRESPYGQGLWFRIHGGKFESNSKSYVRGFDMDYGGVQIGYDRKIENKWDGELYVGAMFGYSKGDLDYHREGSGEVDSKTLGIYGTYIARNGWYVDTILKYQWMTNDFDVIDTAGTLVRGQEVDTGGIGASVEIGKRVHVGQGKENRQGWYLEPQVQLSYQRQDGGYFNATNGLRIGVEPFTSILGRLGMLVGYETDKTNFYAKVSKVKEFDGDLTIRANGVPISESFEDDWWVYGIGCTSRINDRNSLYLDIERTSGGSFSQPWRIFAGWRVEF